MENKKIPHPLVAAIPIVLLIAMLVVIINLFGSDALSGGSQIALIMGMAVCVFISMAFYHVKWRTFERQMAKTMSGIFVTIMILLSVGMLAGSWMISGVVPTLIYYGIELLSPRFFLVTACVICSIVSLLSGSSWTTIATIGVALLGVGEALGIDKAWTAGKMSPLSDTTILASSATRVDLFVHIRYMMHTTVPALSISLVIFLIAGLGHDSASTVNVEQYTHGLQSTFNISLWTLLVPVITGILIARKVPSLIVLFTSSILAGIFALILQPHILCQIADDATLSMAGALTRGLAITFYGATAVDTGYAALNDLVSTGGMAGMLNTVWLILCAMCFGAAMVASGMLESITRQVISWIKSRFSLVASTVSTGLLLNLTTGDQFISIVLNADMFREVYRQLGYEARLLSRTTEDSATVTSVLVPWNTCGMTQATVLGVPTLTYLPYCFFNLLCPLMTLLVAALGWRIKHNDPEPETVNAQEYEVQD